MKPLVLGIIMGFVALFGILLGYAIFPALLKSMLKKQMTLKKGTDVRDMWQVIPFPLDFKLYIFNYTNYQDVAKGGKPIVKEIGPYYYEEWKEKVNLEEIEEEDSISFNTRDTFYFKPELSAPGLTGEEYVYMPHVLLLGSAAYVAKEKPAMLNLFNKSVAAIYDDMTTVFVRVKVRDIFFDGMPINCNKTEFAAKGVCSALRKEVPGIVDAGNGILKFSIFGGSNGTISPQKYKVLRGVKNIMDVGRVVEYNGKPTQEVWGGPNCDDFKGTDGTVFPPFLTSHDTLDSFSPDICRSLPAVYVNKTKYGGITTNHYMADLGDLSNEPDNQCFCFSSDTCPKKGLMDLFKCLLAPMVGSMPHFLNADPSLVSAIQGLNPNPDEHGIHVHFEPISGTPMKAQKRLQFNMYLAKIDKIDWFKDLPDVLAPLFWVEEGLALNKTYVKMLKNQLFLPSKLVKIITWLCIVSGICGMGFAGFKNYKANMVKDTVTPAETMTETAMKNGDAHGGLNALQKSLAAQNPPRISERI